MSSVGTTLHEAMIKVLKDAGAPMTAGEIADAVNTLGLYTRGDKTSVPSNQINARARKYAHLFIKVNGRIGLVGHHQTGAVPPSSTQPPQRLALPRTVPPAHDVRVQSTGGSSAGVLLADSNFRPAGSIDGLVPDRPGLYALRIVDPEALPEPFRAHAQGRGDRLIYIGQASGSLQQRFLGQELRARGNGTFFRSIGAVLGFRPPIGSLASKVNQRNYRFATNDVTAIVSWINRNVEASWITINEDIGALEKQLIARHAPLLNLQGNPRPLAELAAVRRECARTALGAKEPPD